MSIDGKVQKGRLKFEEENGYPIHAVSMVEHQTGIVLTQGHVEKTDVETKDKRTDIETKSKPQENKSKRSKKKRNRRVSLRWLPASSNTSTGKAKC